MRFRKSVEAARYEDVAVKVTLPDRLIALGAASVVSPTRGIAIV
jgi:hypothetical protein